MLQFVISLNESMLQSFWYLAGGQWADRDQEKVTAPWLGIAG